MDTAGAAASSTLFASSCVRRRGCAPSAFNEDYYFGFDPLRRRCRDGGSRTHLGADSTEASRGASDFVVSALGHRVKFPVDGMSVPRRTMTVKNFDMERPRMSRIGGQHNGGPRTLTATLLAMVLELLAIPAFNGAHEYFADPKSSSAGETERVMRAEANTLQAVLKAVQEVCSASHRQPVASALRANGARNNQSSSSPDGGGRRGGFADFDELYDDFAAVLGLQTLDYYADFLRTFLNLARRRGLAVEEVDFSSPLLFPEFRRASVSNLQELIDVACLRREAKSIVGNTYIHDDIAKLAKEQKRMAEMMRDVSRFHLQISSKYGTASGSETMALPQSRTFEKHMDSLKKQLQAVAGDVTNRLGALHSRFASGNQSARLVALYARERLSWGGNRFMFISDQLPRSVLTRFWSEYTVQFMRESPTYNGLSFTAEEKKSRDCVKLLRRTVTEDAAQLCGGSTTRGKCIAQYIPWLDRDQVSMDFCEGFIMVRMPGDAAIEASPRRISCDPVQMGLYMLHNASRANASPRGAGSSGQTGNAAAAGGRSGGGSRAASAVGIDDDDDDTEDEDGLRHVVLESTTTETWEVLPMDLFDLIPAFEKYELVMELERIVRRKGDSWETEAIALVMSEPEVLQPYARKTVSALVGSRAETAEEWSARLRSQVVQLRAAVTVHCVSLRVNSYVTLSFTEDSPTSEDRVVCMRDLTLLHENTKLFSLDR